MDDVFDAALAVVGASYRQIGSPPRVVAAVSGGADSVALLLLLDALRKREGFGLVAAHVHHGLRPQAEEEALAVVRLAAGLGLACAVERVRVPVSGNVEAAAREARYRALCGVALRQGAACIATAHHRQDQAETMLMHLMVGAGSGGLAGMRPWRNGIWRPLLDVDAGTLRDILALRGVSWCEDGSNADLRFTRNRIRHRVLPEMEAVYPAFARKMGESARILSEEDDLLRDMAARWVDGHGLACPGHVWIGREAFLRLPPALQRRALICAADRVSVALNFEKVQELLGAASGAGRGSVNLAGGARALVTQGRLHFIARETKGWPMGNIEWQSPAMLLGDGHFTQAFDADRIAGCELRARRAGDFIVPLGQTGRQSLKAYMIDRKIDQPFRAFWPVLACGSEVIWVIGCGASQRAAVSRHTEKAVYGAYRGALPDGRKNSGGEPT